MNLFGNNFLEKLLIEIPILLLSLTVHEFSHGWMADKLGDDTARRMGRLTLNPLPHIDPIGLVLLFVASFGWAKPVPFNPFNFRNYKTGTLLVALAGPTSNFILAAICGTIFSLLVGHSPQMLDSTTLGIIAGMLQFAVFINLILAFFNLLPLGVLDGTKILFGLIPREWEPEFHIYERYSTYGLIALIAAAYFLHINLLGIVIMPFVSFFMRLFTGSLF